MATIEERAIQFAESTPDSPTIFVANKAYTRGAQDQVNIDIEVFERFLDQRNLLACPAHGRAWEALKRKMRES